jgi:hypothetical protein
LAELVLINSSNKLCIFSSETTFVFWPSEVFFLGVSRSCSAASHKMHEEVSEFKEKVAFDGF